jgi:hypothetical protein
MNSKISRRSLLGTLARLPILVSAACFGIYARLAPAQQQSPAELSAEQMAKLERVVWLLFPVNGLDSGPYQRTAAGIVQSASANPERFEMLKLGLDELDGNGAFMKQSESVQTDKLRRMEQGAFFQFLLMETRSRFWDDREVWKRIGYEGSSLEKGGYINHGLADIDWL